MSIHIIAGLIQIKYNTNVIETIADLLIIRHVMQPNLVICNRQVYLISLNFFSCVNMLLSNKFGGFVY